MLVLWIRPVQIQCHGNEEIDSGMVLVRSKLANEYIGSVWQLQSGKRVEYQTKEDCWKLHLELIY